MAGVYKAIHQSQRQLCSFSAQNIPDLVFAADLHAEVGCYSHKVQALDISMILLRIKWVLHMRLDNGPSKGHCHSISYHVSLLFLLSVFHLATLLDQFSDMAANL